MTAATTRQADAAASELLRDLLTGPPIDAAVVATGPAATYLDAAGRLLAVVAAGGVRLPCAVVLAAPGARPPAGDGPGLAVGDGAVWRAGEPVVRVRRWFDPRVRIPAPAPDAVARLGARLRGADGADPLLPAAVVDRLAAGLAKGDPRAAVNPLLGRGGGLTPAGDDLVAGALAALRAVGSPAAGALGAAVAALAPGRTTRLSAALLAAADQGAVVPEAAAVLRALATAAGDPAGLDAAVDRLVALGHTSGWHLAAGLAAGLGRAVTVPAARRAS